MFRFGYKFCDGTRKQSQVYRGGRPWLYDIGIGLRVSLHDPDLRVCIFFYER